MHFVEATRDLMRNGRLSRACLPEKNETTLGSGMVHPIDDEVQEGHARSRKTAFLRCEARAFPIWDFSDFCIQVYDDYQIDYPTNPQVIRATYQRLKLGVTPRPPWPKLFPHRPEFETQLSPW